MTGQLGLERTPEEYVAALVAVFREVWRVLRDDGTLWLNLGDCYTPVNRGHNAKPRSSPEYAPQMQGTHWAADLDRSDSSKAPGLKPKDLVGIPWRVAFALQADGWYLRRDIIWSKPNPMPESVTDRPTTAHEYLFLMAKRERYYYDAEAIKEAVADATLADRVDTGRFRPDRGFPGTAPSAGNGRLGSAPSRNRRSVWEIATQPFSYARFLGGDGGGSGRITSPDCPVHGDRGCSASKARRDAPRAASDPARSPRSETRPAQAPIDGLAPIGTRPVEGFSLDSWGSPDPASESTATPRSTETHRTAPAPETLPRETCAVESGDDIARSAPQSERAATSDRTPESNTATDSAADDSGSGASVYTEPRNGGKCSCTIIDHFATFPEALVEPCILAGTSERGACAACGAPWGRLVERGARQPEPEHRGGVRLAEGQAGNGTIGARFSKLSGQEQAEWKAEHPDTTTGWQPTCACTAPTTPPFVLDPFAGSGTVGLVCQRLGRRFVGLELKPDYCAMAYKRTAQMGLV